VTLTVRSATVSGATTKGSALTHAELDENFNHLSQSSNHTFTPSGSGAVARTVQSKLRDKVCVFDFMTAAEIAAVQAYSYPDVATAVQAALDTGYPVHAPGGGYGLSARLNMNALAHMGQRFFGDGPAREDLGTGTNKTIFKPTSAVSVGIFLDGSSVGSRGCELADFSIDMDSMTDASTRIGIQTQDAFSNKFKNITFLNQGSNKRSFKFLDGTLLTTVENCRGTIVELNGVDLADAVVGMLFLNCDFDSYVMESAAQINVFGGAVQGALDKFDLTDKVEGLTIFGVDIEGTGTFLKCGTNITQINQHSNYFDGFSGTFSSGSWTNSGGLFYRETNSWTPTLAFGGAAVDLTYSNQGASATREGNRVHCTLDFIIGSNGSSSGAAVISGLPYAGSASFNQDFAINVNNGTLTGQLFGRIAPGASTIALFVTADGATAAATEANITDNCTMRAVFTYMVD
jgi:hypothetical protein